MADSNYSTIGFQEMRLTDDGRTTTKDDNGHPRHGISSTGTVKHTLKICSNPGAGGNLSGICQPEYLTVARCDF